MSYLYQEIADRVTAWRAENYPCSEYPTIAEILEWAYDNETGHSRFLRRPQVQALETYWYLRLVANTPHVFAEYRDDQDRPRRYTPDFIIRKKGKAGKPGKCLIVEIKDARWQLVVKDEMSKGSAVSLEGRKALAATKWVNLNPDRLQYQLIFAKDVPPAEAVAETRAFIDQPWV